MGVNILVSGGERSGKTTFVKNDLIPDFRKVAPVLICDVKGYDYNDVADCMVDHPKDFLPAVKAGHRVIRWKPEFNFPATSKHSDGSTVEEIDKFVEGVDRVLKEVPYVWQVIDEAHNFMDGSGIRAPKLSKVFREGNSAGIATCLISQDPRDFPKNAYAGAQDYYVFGVSGVPERLEDHMTRDPSAAKNLEQYHYLHITKGQYQKNSKHEPIDI